MKGILLCGGLGTRLRPLTHITNKHLIPVYDRPMVLFPIETLKALDITDILLVSGGNNIGSFADFLGDGSSYGVNLTYRVQKEAVGIAQALSLAKDFTQNEKMAVILGDNIYDNMHMKRYLDWINKTEEAVLFIKQVKNAQRFGVPTLHGDKILKITEKPEKPDSNFAITGLYIYPHDVFDVIDTLTPSDRGEYEISDVNNYYVSKDRCTSIKLEGFWSDAGTFDSLLESSEYVKLYMS